ncbi:hypothetical protein AUK11_02435 [bacterium CG2_30_37_16]|nr:MAG: hypothetical protein AUK11_02435 [bacterium CG2_30_37_16]PIP30267.1 MAG: hypothetical protein COX25_05585 [bacterium (Candidatus Howlettbacteria) CG23_combo_of_CG06-09_8_20_14_all_37_9]PIY00099.1 MAG: hypothetical protein COZ22_01135 [bacterium (Candidatus Howlettbacteria) CG_4_10_14_3_um_filter_37_10]PJB06560.1 MAG: hypothetical protein CO123_01940 [bacterium (Candidatus Howlettbacteria) CG_4_9_14_3_um_filter_37_10]
MKHAIAIQLDEKSLNIQDAREGKKGFIFGKPLSVKLEFGNIKEPNFDNLHSVLLKIKKKNRRKFKKSFVVLTLPDRVVFYTNEFIPSSISPKEIEDSIKLNAELETPIVKDECVIHWQEIENVRGEKGKKEFLVGVTPINFIEGLINTFKKTNISLHAIETFAFSHFRSVKESVDKETNLLGVYVINNELSIYVVEAGNLRFIQNEKIETKTPFEFVEQAIIRVLSYYFAGKKNFKIDSFYLDFNESTKKALTIKLQQDLSLDIQLVDKNERFSKENASNMVLAGALDRSFTDQINDVDISLMPFGVREEYIREKNYIFLDTIANISVTLALVIIGIFISVLVFVYKYESNIDGSISLNIAGQSQKSGEIEKRAEEFNAQVSRIKNFENNAIFVDQYLKDINDAAPKNTKVAKIEIDSLKRSIVIDGNSNTRDEILAFKEALKNNKSFIEVDLPLSSIEQKNNPIFKINIKIK